MMNRVTRLVLSALWLLLTCCSTGWANDKLSVFVSILPQTYFVNHIGRDFVDVQVMVQPGSDPHAYEPKPSQMVALSKAVMYIAIGAPFESRWLGKIASINPEIKLVFTDSGIKKLPMANGDHNHDHSSADGSHNHGTDHEEASGLDPHIWLSPALAQIQSTAIVKALQEMDPAHAKAYETNYQKLIAEIQALDQELKTLFKGKHGLRFLTFHPAWGYFAHEYGLKQIPVEIEGKSPKPAQLRQLIHYARQHQIKVVFVHPQFSPRYAKMIAREIGGQVVFVDPLAADWAENLRQVAEKFKSALK